MHFPRFNSDFQNLQNYIGDEMIGATGVLIIWFLCTNVTIGQYLIQSTSTLSIASTTELIPTAKKSMIASGISGTAYCAIIQCKTISCSSIDSSDPGIFVSNFVTTVFQNQCPTMKTIKNLIFKECKFPEGRLKNSWQMSNIEVENLRFEDCELHEIDVDAFTTPVFKNTKNLAIINAKITTLKRRVFQKLSNLISLTIHDNIIIEAEYDLLNSLAGSLQTIDLDRSITNPQVLLNITNGTQLSQVQLLSLQGNNIPYISQDTFNGFPNILSLYIDSSKIMKIDANAFKFIRYIQQIFMNNNLLATLPNGLFDSILLYNPNFKLSIADNPWHCDCELKWMQNMILKYPKVFFTIPKCQTPEINNGKSFVIAELCDKSSDNELSPQNFTSVDTVKSSTETQNDTESIDNNFINFTCENFKFLRPGNVNGSLFYKVNNYKFQLLSPLNYSINEYNNGTVSIITNDYENLVTIIWFQIDTNRIGYINCLKNVKGRILLKNLNKDSTYIICVLNKLQWITSPINCSILKTVALTETKNWFSNEDKPTVLSIYSITSILFVLFGSGICYFIIRKHPSILRGSSRVIMVKRGRVRALILPKGATYDEIQRQRIKRKSLAKNTEMINANYITPIDRRNNYLSNFYETICYKINSTNNPVDNAPPPLPPHPHHDQSNYKQQLSSVSLRIDTQQSKAFDDQPYEIEEDTGTYYCN